MSSHCKSDHAFAADDPERIAFVKDNAVALVNDAECKIERLRDRIRRLENANREMRKHCNTLQEYLKWALQERLSGNPPLARIHEAEAALERLRVRMSDELNRLDQMVNDRDAQLRMVRTENAQLQERLRAIPSP